MENNNKFQFLREDSPEYSLWLHLYNEHHLTLTQDELHQIILLARKTKLGKAA